MITLTVGAVDDSADGPIMRRNDGAV